MKKSGQASAPESSQVEELARLTDAVRALAEEVRVVRDVLDEIRDDVGWITRNAATSQSEIH